MCLPPIVVQDDRTGIASYELPDEFCYQITASVDGNSTAVVSGRVEAGIYGRICISLVPSHSNVLEGLGTRLKLLEAGMVEVWGEDILDN